uniref:Myc-induced nuclear antigen with a molecular mass of 53 kDa-like 1 n=1 Tax=Phallusia mammillata TaxID=59560 RepID=A0A6F9DFP0_9ASCI|nr:myc-induced nuclear antigen with a molecular mass of 53 kDa-like 1 [Phallusia mammillata]
MWIVLAIFIFINCCHAKDDPIGHNQWLGYHRPSEGHIDVIEKMLHPTVFWEKYGSIGKPALFKGAAFNMPAISKWTDDYLLQNYGELRVKLESKHEKAFKPEGNLGMGQDSIRYFINTYKNKDKYMVSQIPDPLSKEVTVPQCILCGTLRKRILEANIWMSSGDTKSILHRDADNAFNCLLNGTKDWILIDPKHQDLLPIAVEAGTPYGGFTLINVNKVDLKKYPKFRDVPWYYANITAGDCLFLPKGHWHQVRSYGEKNLAVSILFSRINEFDDEGCSKDDLPPVEMLSDVPMVWTYDGFAAQTMGNTDPFELNDTVIELCESGNGVITQKILDDHVMTTAEVVEDEHHGTIELNVNDISIPKENFEILHERSIQIMKLLDQQDLGYFPCDNMSHVDVEMLKQIADILDPDPANTKDYEFLSIKPSDLRKTIKSSVKLLPQEFTQKYVVQGGSRYGADWVLGVLDANSDGDITLSEMKTNMEKVLDRYKKKMMKDISGPQMDKAIDFGADRSEL